MSVSNRVRSNQSLDQPLQADSPGKDGESSEGLTRRDFMRKTSGLAAKAALTSSIGAKGLLNMEDDGEENPEKGFDPEEHRVYTSYTSDKDLIELSIGFTTDEARDSYIIPKDLVSEIENDNVRDYLMGDLSKLSPIDLNPEEVEFYSNIIEEESIGKIGEEETLSDFKEDFCEDYSDIGFDSVKNIDGNSHYQVSVEDPEENEIFSDESLVGHEHYHGNSLELSFKHGKAYLEMLHGKTPQDILGLGKYKEAKEGERELDGDEEALFNLYQLMY